MTGAFVQVRCPECSNEQTLFDKAASTVSCVECGHTLARPASGRATIDAEVLETVGAP